MDIFGNYLVGYNGTVVSLFIAAAVCCVLLLIWFVTSRKDGTFYLLLCYTLLPLFIMFIISQTVPVFLPRQLILFSLFLYVMMSKGILHIKNKFLCALVCGILVLLYTPALINYYKGRMPAPLQYHQGVVPKKPIEPVVSFIKRNMGPDDIIAHSNYSTVPPF